MTAGRDDRAVTVTLNYILVLGISATLVSGLLFAGSTFVEDQRERVIEDELTVIGTHIAGDIEQVDRMVQASQTEPTRATLNQTFPRTVSGTTYSVALNASTEAVVLESNSPGVTVRVSVANETALDGTASAFGGDTSVRYDSDAVGGAGGLVVSDD